jgi:hypothetical protein
LRSETYLDAYGLPKERVRILSMNARSDLSGSAGNAGGMTLVNGEQQSAIRRTISAWQTVQFLIETLKTQTEAERTGVLEEECSNLFSVFAMGGLNQIIEFVSRTPESRQHRCSFLASLDSSRFTKKALNACHLT